MHICILALLMQALEGIIKSLMLAHEAKKMAYSLKNTTQ